MDTKNLYEQLSAPMPPESLHEDSSRGFTLTSIRAGFVIERLNLVFGLLGHGWRFDYGQWQAAGEKSEIVVDVVLQWRVDSDGCHPVRFNKGHEAGLSEWYLDRDSPAVWSEPVFSTGGSSLNRKGSQPFLDAHKSAVTSGLTKAAARLGVGIEIFKGENDNHVEGNREGRQKPARPSGSRVSAPAPRVPVKSTPVNGVGSGFTTITAMINAAAGEMVRLDKMEEVAVAEGDEKSLGSLANRMKRLGVKGQAVRLVAALLGEGPLTNKRVLACYGLLNKKEMDEAAVSLLNTAIFAREVEQAQK